MENVISEFKVIETEDGYRIEIKGEKDQIKSFISEFGVHSVRKRWRGHQRGFRWGPWPMHPKIWMKMARCWESWYEDSEDEESPDSV